MPNILPLAAALALIAAPAAAQSPFDGTWKGDVTSSAVEAKPDQYLLKDGTYNCASCLPPLTVKADGAFQAVKDRPYYDHIAIRAVDDRTVKQQYRQAGRVVADATLSLSPDGNTLTVASSNTNNAAGVPIAVTRTQTRIAPTPAGAHAISGSWKAAPASSVSDAGMTVTLKVEGDTLNLTSPIGETLTAKLGGPYALNVGDPGKTMTKAERLSPNSLRLTDMRQGKVVQVSTYTVSADGTTLNGEWQDPRNGAKGTFVARKQ